MHLFYIFIHPAIILTAFPVKSHGGAGANPSCHCARRRVHPGPWTYSKYIYMAFQAVTALTHSHCLEALPILWEERLVKLSILALCVQVMQAVGPDFGLGVNLFIYRPVPNSAAAQSTFINFGCKRKETWQEGRGTTEWKKRVVGGTESKGLWSCFKR